MARLRRSGLGRPCAGDVSGGLVAGLTSIPEGLGYAQLALINPMMGIYAGMAPVIAGAFGSGTVLMMTTLTSAIALTVGGVLASGAIPAEQTASAVVTISLLAGLFMLLLGWARLGRLVNVISHAVMTGFVVGIGLLIIVSKVPAILGSSLHGSGGKAFNAVDVLVHPGSWDFTAATLGLGTLTLVLVLQSVRKTRKLALLIGVLAGTVVALVGHLDVPVVADGADIISGLGALPIPNSLEDLPDLALIPQCALAALAVTLIALAEGAGIRPAFPNPDGSPSSPSRDFVGAGVANLAASVFMSPPVGGSLSRTAMSASSGGRTRWAAVFAAAWLIMIILVAAPAIGAIPIPVIAGILIAIGVEIVLGRSRDIVVAWEAGRTTFGLLVLTAILVITIPIQYAIAVPVALSILEFSINAAHGVRIVRYERDGKGWKQLDGPPDPVLAAGRVTVISREGPTFHAAVPGVIDLLPRPAGAGAPGVLVIDVSSIEDVGDTLARSIDGYVRELQAAGAGLVLCGVQPKARQRMERFGLIDLIGPENVLTALPHLGANIDAGAERGAHLTARMIRSEPHG